MAVAEVHIHQFENKEIKVKLYNYEWDAKRREWNYVPSAHDYIQMKVCKCGRKEPFGKVKRVVI